MTQLQLHFEPGLTDQFKTLEDVLSTVVYSSRQGLQGSATECDQSPSELSRRLNKTDALPLRVRDMEGILDATRDMRPIYWLIEKYLQDRETAKQMAEQQFISLMPIMFAYAEKAGILEGGKLKAVK